MFLGVARQHSWARRVDIRSGRLISVRQERLLLRKRFNLGLSKPSTISSDGKIESFFKLLF